jgi:hypothetical protein
MMTPVTFNSLIFPHVLFVDPVRIRWRSAERFCSVIERKPINLAQVVYLTDSKHNRFEVTVEPTHDVRGRHIAKIPCADGCFDWLKKRIFADAGFSAEDQGVVDLLTRPLHPVRQPTDDVLRVIRINGLHVVKPR